MLLLAEGHLDPVMGACTLFAHLSSSFDVSTELDLIVSDNALPECRERFQTEVSKFKSSSSAVLHCRQTVLQTCLQKLNSSSLWS